MQNIVSAKQMQAIDQYTINEIGIPSLVLMERAAIEISNKLIKNISKKESILALCGTGNNGADGIVAARILQEVGYQVDIRIIGDEQRSSKEFQTQLQIARNLGINIINNAKISEYTIIIDAIFGVGLSRPVTGIQEMVINEVNANDNKVYSVDVPSGISATDGKVCNVAIKAEETITFGFAKIGLLLYPGCEYAGNVTVADIGFPKKALEQHKTHSFIYEKKDLERLPKRPDYSNKGTFGRVLVIAGSKNMSGACYFSAKAAYRTGCGLVKILTAEENRNILQTDLPEAILSTYDANNLKNKIEIDRIINELNWANVIVIGPGIGMSPSANLILDIVVKNANVPVVVDADGINLLAGNPHYVYEDEMQKRVIHVPSNVILTPHLKEMSRLLDSSTEDVKQNMLSVAKSATDNESFVLALKDARTIVTNGTDLYINISGNSGMSTGGSGDVLTGIIAALIAQGMDNYEATCLGVYIHGLAGDKARDDKGAYSVMASDIIDALPDVLK